MLKGIRSADTSWAIDSPRYGGSSEAGIRPDKAEQNVLALMAHLRAAGLTTRAIASQLNA
jgi:hypothetical protein